MDEFQAPGKLTDEEGKPTINKLLDRGRSKGWGSFLLFKSCFNFTTPIQRMRLSSGEWLHLPSC